jgi:hypothetical protein
VRPTLLVMTPNRFDLLYEELRLVFTNAEVVD